MSNRRKPKSVDITHITAAAKPAEVIVRLCLSGDLFAEHQRLEEQLADASDDPVKMNELSEAQKIAKRIGELEERMEDSTVEFLFRQIGRREWREMKADCPTKTTRAASIIDLQVDRETFGPKAVAACCVSPTGLDDPDKLEAFWDKLSVGQADRLLTGAWGVNEDGVSIPFSAAASVIRASYAPSSTTASP